MKDEEFSENIQKGGITMNAIKDQGKPLSVGWKAARCWFWPFFKSRFYNSRLRPGLSFLFTDLACNYHCYYCYGSHVPNQSGMTIETARQAVDWLHSLGCRVLAIMGGEPLVRKPFLLDVTRYANKRGFYVYLPTNGALLDEPFADQISEAGLDMLNLAVDCIDEKPGLPKALNRIRPQYEMLLKKNAQGKFLLMFNINITPRNIEDVKELTEIAHRDDINVDYHVIEPPLRDQPHFCTPAEEIRFSPGDYEKLDALFDWLLSKYSKGYRIANSPLHFQVAKRFIRRQPIKWECLAGFNTLVIMADGRLMPCFEFFADDRDWGKIGKPKFDAERLTELKKHCNSHCLSTCNFTTSYYCHFSTILEWVAKHYRART